MMSRWHWCRVLSAPFDGSGCGLDVGWSHKATWLWRWIFNQPMGTAGNLQRRGLQGHWWMTGTDLRCDEGWSSSSCWRAVCAHCDGVGTGGELVFSVQGAGGRWREWRRVVARETGGGTEEWTLPQEESLPLTVRRWEERRKISFHVLGFEHNASLRWSSPDCVAAVVGGVCHPSNKELLWGSIWLHPPWGMSFPRFTHFGFKTAE